MITLKDFLGLWGDVGTNLTLNDNNLNCISKHRDHFLFLEECKNEKLLNTEVVAFSTIADTFNGEAYVSELCVRLAI